MRIPIFYMLVGLPGSGKSYLAKKLAEEHKAIIHSSDAIREELSGDVNNQNVNSDVFNLLHKRVKEDLTSGYNVIYDATNTSYKRRKAFLQELTHIDCLKVCYLVATPYEVCLEQNESRDRKVPEDVIDRMYKNIDVPYYYEGWDNIELYYSKDSYKEAYGLWSQFIFDTLTYEQDNKYHSETLGEHCRQCMQYVCDKLIEDDTNEEGSKKHLQIVAAALHDCGKPFCKGFVDAKGNPCDSAHYYNHEKVGSYNSLFYITEHYSDNEKLIIAALIRWHMQMHFIDKAPHTESKYRTLLGEKLYKQLQILHAGDKGAH